ncbi:MAG: acyl-CoA dehydratase activase [Bacillota bacterium]
MYVAGLDLGSSTTKVVITSLEGEILSTSITPSAGNYRNAAEIVMQEATGKLGMKPEDMAMIVAGGFGAQNVPFPFHPITEISAQGRGVHKLFGTVRTVIDVGGQATKVVKVDEHGRGMDFVISEKCAAGSGRFLQVIARVLQVSLEDIGPISLQADSPVDFTTNCAVFAESETISRVAEGFSAANILAGMHIAVASKIENLVRRVGMTLDCAMTGGGAKDIGLVKAIEEKLGITLLVPEDPQITGALGAAVLAAELTREANKNQSA